MNLTTATLSGVLALVASDAVAADPSAKVVRFAIDTTKDVRPISPYIYGMNAEGVRHSRPLNRLGGNRWSAYNWENNASNAGADWHHQSDGYLSESDRPGEAVRPAIEAAAKAGQALVVTVPMCGYVSADKNADGDVAKTPDYLTARFRRNVARKSGPLATTPDLSDAAVYQDEFVNWVETAGRADSKQVIFYALDNEPDLWSQTHARIHPEKVTYEEMVKKTVEFAGAIKGVKRDAMVLGFVSYGWNGFRTLQDAPDGGGRDFIEYFLQSMKQAEASAGERLVDVLDLHWYPEARGGGVRVTEKDASPAVVAARVQAPRSLWDPAYTETSWITEHSTRGPIRLLPRVREMIEKHCPGTKLALTEYTFGAGNHISGGIAEADALGIFAREGIFAAAWWDTGTGVEYVHAAMDSYLNFDGAGGRVGDTSVSAVTDDIESSAVHASTDSSGRVVAVLINRSEQPIAGQVTVAGRTVGGEVKVYRLDGSGPAVKGAGSLSCAGGRLECPLPPMSVTTLVLTSR